MTIALSELGWQLERHYRELPMVCVDEYDAILNKVYIESFLEENEKERIFSFFFSFYTTLGKGNSIYNLIMTGTNRWRFVTDFSGMNNALYFNVLELDNVGRYYGMDPEHAQHLMREYGLIEQNHSVFNQYNGYSFGYDNSIVKLNPYSMAMFLSKKKLDDYWVQSNNGIEWIKKLLPSSKFRSAIYDLMMGKETIIDDLEYGRTLREEMHLLSKVIHTSPIINSSYELPAALKILLTLGYFTKVHLPTENVEAGFFSRMMSIKIPNQEVNISI